MQLKNTMPLRGNHCECCACHQRFNSVTAFDLHRAGVHGVDRHCREPGEMLAIGMRLNLQGFWIERRRGESRRTTREKSGPRAQETRSAQTRYPPIGARP